MSGRGGGGAEGGFGSCLTIEESLSISSLRVILGTLPLVILAGDHILLISLAGPTAWELNERDPKSKLVI